ncbi:hypothetical protein M514_00091 [Trichuris suis]|nr:hypothetical protein M514_00091 [Trichuris suis]
METRILCSWKGSSNLYPSIYEKSHSNGSNAIGIRIDADASAFVAIQNVDRKLIRSVYFQRCGETRSEGGKKMTVHIRSTSWALSRQTTPLNPIVFNIERATHDFHNCYEKLNIDHL